MITSASLLRIVFRWKRIGLTVFAFCFVAGTVIALIEPLKYEAVVGIEKKPAQISLQPLSAEYDVTRYTSEDERTIAVLKSRFMMLEWLKAIGITEKTPGQLERQLKKLDKRFIVKPVNFTDLYMLRVQADSPQEAIRRGELIVKLFENWNATQDQNESEEIISLLRRRLDVIRAELSEESNHIQKLKLSRTINLSGSTSESEIDTDIKAKQTLYSGLTDELEKAERGVDPLSVHRVRIVIPMTASEKPVYSHSEYLLIAFCISVLSACAAIFLKERQTSRIFRVSDSTRGTVRLPSGLSI